MLKIMRKFLLPLFRLTSIVLMCGCRCCGIFEKIPCFKFGVLLQMALIGLLPSSTFAQMNFCSSVGKVDLISVKRVGQNEGQITFSVKDKEGNNVDTDIAPDEISLLINGHEVCNKVISRESRALLDLVIAVDVSKSMDDAIDALQKGLPDLITAIAEKYETNAVVTTFGHGNYDECDFQFYEDKLIPIVDPILFREIYYTGDRIATNQKPYNYEGYYSMLLQIARKQYDFPR